MKVPTDNIYKLIQSMTASEKRYFKRHYASEKNLTTDLFDFINSLDEYEEDSVKKHFINSKLAKNLKVYKVQLMDLLLKSLTSYHNKKSIRSKIRMGLEEVEILMNKQLHSMAISRLKKIKELCLKHEELEYIFAIVHFEIFLNSFFDIDLKPGEYAILEELEGYTEVIKNVYRLKKINFSLNDKNNNELTDMVREEEIVDFTQILEHDLALPSDRALTLSEQYYRNSSLSILHKLLNKDTEKEFEFKNNNVRIFEKNPYFIKNNAGFYFAALFNFLVCCRRLKRFAELEKGLEQIKELIQQYPVLKRNAVFIHYLEIKHYFLQKKYKSITNILEPEITQHIRKYKQKEEHLIALIYIYFTLSNLVLKDYHKVHFYLRRLSANSKHLADNYTYFFYILELISHHETEDTFVIQNLLSSHRRKIKGNNDTSVFFKAVLDLFQQLQKASAKEKKELAIAFEQEIAKMEPEGTYNIAREFILEDWLSALKAGQTYAEVMSD